MVTIFGAIRSGLRVVDIDKRGSANVSPVAYDAILAIALESRCPGERCE